MLDLEAFVLSQFVTASLPLQVSTERTSEGAHMKMLMLSEQDHRLRTHSFALHVPRTGTVLYAQLMFGRTSKLPIIAVQLR